MRLYEVVHLFARRLGLKVGRVRAIAGKLQDEGKLQKTEGSRRFPLDVSEPEVVTLLLALLGESGIGTGPSAAKTFGDLATLDGERFAVFLENLLFGQPKHVRHLMVRQNPAGVSVTADNMHLLFGEPPSRGNASPARIVPGEALTAIAAELQGLAPEQADAAAALNAIGRL